jgi:hypothetical protein
MGDIDNTNAIMAMLDQAGAEMLQLAALTLQQQATADHRAGKNPPPYTNPAPQGSFPHVRTGFLASSFMYVPASIGAIRKEQRVRIGYRASAFYGIALGFRGWKWLKDSLDKCMPLVQAQLQGFTIKGP